MELKSLLFSLIIIGSILFSSCSNEEILTDHGFKTEVDSITIEVQFYSPEIVRIIKSKAGFSFMKNSLAVIKEAEPVSFSIKDQRNFIIAATSKLTVKLDKTSGEVSFTKINGNNLITEKANGSTFTMKNDIGESTFFCQTII